MNLFRRKYNQNNPNSIELNFGSELLWRYEDSANPQAAMSRLVFENIQQHLPGLMSENEFNKLSTSEARKIARRVVGMIALDKQLNVDYQELIKHFDNQQGLGEKVSLFPLNELEEWLGKENGYSWIDDVNDVYWPDELEKEFKQFFDGLEEDI